MTSKAEVPFVSPGRQWGIAILLGALVHIIGVSVGAVVLQAAGGALPRVPAGSSPALPFTLLGSGVVAITAMLLARGVAGSLPLRAAVIALFFFVAGGVNTAIESATFTSLGGEWGMVGTSIVPAILVGLVTAWGITPLADDTRRHRLATLWTARPRLVGRLALGWAAFPVIYFLFGMAVAPIVLPSYQGGIEFLHVPPMSELWTVLPLRSALFLAVSLPIIALWSGTRRSLGWCLGLAHFVNAGFYGLLLATFFPPVLRLAHGVEILADSLVYGWVLVLLFFPSERKSATVG